MARVLASNASTSFFPPKIYASILPMDGRTETDNCLFDELVRNLSSTLGPDSGLTTVGTNTKRLTQLMTEYSSRESDWQRYAFSDPSRAYTRNLVDKGNGKSNLLILVWAAGKSSPIHDHANSHCLMKILKGSLTETLYEWPDHNEKGDFVCSALKVKKESLYAKNMVTYMSDDLGLHRISNPDPNNDAVSLHLYTPPNAAKVGCHIFDKDTGRRTHVSQCGVYSEYGARL